MTAAAQLRHAEPDELLTVAEAAKLLGVGIRTFYRLAWFKTRKVHPTDSTAHNAAVRYRRSDVALYQSLRGGHTQLRRMR